MKETYRQMSKRHQSEFNNFPCFFAFSMKQFEEGMEKLGVKSESELYQGIGGMFYRRTDAPKLHEMMERNHNEMQEALHKDMDFLYHAVRYELDVGTGSGRNRSQRRYESRLSKSHERLYG